MARVFPPRFHSALRAIKEYVGRMPEGVSLTLLCSKVNQYNALCRKDKELLIELIEENDILAVERLNQKTTLHHRKFGHSTPITAPIQHQEDKPMAVPTPATSMLTLTKKSPATLRKEAADLQEKMNNLLKLAEEEEKETGARTELRRKFDPIKLDVLQKFGMASRKFDDYMNAMGDLEKAMQQLREFSV